MRCGIATHMITYCSLLSMALLWAAVSQLELAASMEALQPCQLDRGSEQGWLVAVFAKRCAEEPACCAEGSTGAPRPLCTGSSDGPPGGSTHLQRPWLRLKHRPRMKSVMVARFSLSQRTCSRGGGAAGCCRWMLSLTLCRCA